MKRSKNFAPKAWVISGLLAAAIGLTGPTVAQDEKSEPYSPYAERDFATQVFFGDTHLHTSFSADAGAFGNRLDISEAYKFARGEQVTATSGQAVQLSRPLDFLVVADHSDGMGFIPDLIAGTPNILAVPEGKDWHERINQGRQSAVGVAREIIGLFSQGKIPKGLMYTPDTPAYKAAWQKTIDLADAYNDPGKFTAFIGFEWTSLILGNNLHRVVMYRDGADIAGKMVPYTTVRPYGSPNPRDLWKWLANYEATTGGQIMAFAHNGNLSNGIMFPVDAQYDGVKIDRAYVDARAAWEPLYEVTQIKGDGEAHPFLSPDDAFADFENWDVANLDLSQAKTQDMLKYEYAREALKQGLALEAKMGTNPYKFGLIGSTDSHTSLATPQEDNFFGKHTGVEPSPKRMVGPLNLGSDRSLQKWSYVASGLAAVWAKENTREAIFDAMERKEVYATTGSRLRVRFFGGWSFQSEDLNNRQLAKTGYAKGVPMGGDLKSKPAEALTPSFLVFALRDAMGANIDRIQIVKGWLDQNGVPQEKVFDIAWSGNRQIGADGVLPSVGSTVDVANASWSNTIGAAELGTVWADPEFDASQRAFYYARVIEIPTPRWSTYDAKQFGVAIPEGAPVSVQDRAYTSPIWYTPTE